MVKSTLRVFEKENLNYVSFPMGGIGAGMIALDGTGAFSHVSLFHRPDVFNEPLIFAALHVKDTKTARVLEGPTPLHKAFGAPGSGLGGNVSKNLGLPRFANTSFVAQFPFGKVRLRDPSMPVKADITGWSPFIPNDADNSSLPVAGVEYQLTNTTGKPVVGVFSFHSRNFTDESGTGGRIEAIPGGFLLSSSEESASRIIGNWRVSRRLEKKGAIDKVGCVSLKSDLTWRDMVQKKSFLNLHDIFGSADGLVYAGTHVQVEKKGTWIFRIGHDGGMRLFVDGKPVIADPRLQNPLIATRTSVSVTLDEGIHEIVIAFDLAAGMGWGIVLSFVAEKGTTGFPTPDTWVSGGGSLAAFTDSPGAKIDCAWLHGGGTTGLWKTIAMGAAPARPPHEKGASGEGASLYVPFKLKAGESRTIRVLLAWYMPTSSLVIGNAGNSCGCNGGSCNEPSTYVPWYAARFKSADDIVNYWRKNYDYLRIQSLNFSNCFYDTNLPGEVVAAVAANLTVLKSPTVLRQHDGRLWGWEGCGDREGSCHGSCTHVWNYAQAICHLFPSLERTLRETEFMVCQDERGYQLHRSPLPIRPPTEEERKYIAASDGQLGGIMKLYRDWRISGDTDWMEGLWPRVRKSLDYCILSWDPDHTGTLIEPHHNTYDVQFWGPDGMCTSFYIGALQAAIIMGEECGADVAFYKKLLAKGKRAMEKELWNGEYFFQKVRWRDLHVKNPEEETGMTEDVLAILRKEGPKCQYGTGCLSDGVIGDWMARVCGLGAILDVKKTQRHLNSVYRYNYRPSLADHANPQRAGLALGQEGGLILCSWPKGGELTLPFPYSYEVWTGIEYQVAAHLIMMGRVKEGLAIVKTVRARYDGTCRNPFNEYECGHWYARAMSSYSLLQALSGARYDAVEKTLYLEPKVKGDFRAFICTVGGYGTVGVRKGRPFLEVKDGTIEVNRMEYGR